MQNREDKFLVGLISPQVLEAAESDPLAAVFIDLQAVTAVEIRYDWFDESLWPELSKRVRAITPKVMQIGTIRLKRDGGSYPNEKASCRLPLWKSILQADQVPEWLDLEQDDLYDFAALRDEAAKVGTKILVSQHNFSRIPTQQELDDFARDVLRVGAPGLKIAAMSQTDKDCDRLYRFIQEQAKNFELFAAFGMGETGKVSRVWTLKEGANLTYGSIGGAAAPGQIDVITMEKAIHSLKNINSPFELSQFLNKF